MKRILAVLLLFAMITIGCAGSHPWVLVTDGSYTGNSGIVFDGKLNPDEHNFHTGG